MQILPRLHLFEFEDQDFCPVFIRDALTNYLNCIWCTGQFYRCTLPIIQRALDASGHHRIIDLCSGGGGAIPKISQRLLSTHPNLQVTLSDFYPNLDAFQSIAQQSEGKINYIQYSVDARTQVTSTPSMYTMFLALHHFAPEDVGAILQTRTQNKDTIAIFEIQQRRVFDVLLMLVHFPLCWLLLPFLRPTLSQLFFTYLIPIIPLLIVWDGMVSTLRTYSPDEIRGMLSEEQQQTYTWEFGRVFHPLHSVQYCLGIPKGTSRLL